MENGAVWGRESQHGSMAAQTALDIKIMLMTDRVPPACFRNQGQVVLYLIFIFLVATLAVVRESFIEIWMLRLSPYGVI